jgi:hypothetical protein
MVLNLDEASKTDVPVTLGTSQPIITGTAAPNVTVTIEVHSDTQISKTLTANADGTFSLNIAELSKNLEPGEHTVTYSYISPTTGKPVPETVTFYVEPQSTSANLLAQANASATPRPTATPRATATPSATPFGSSNPFPIGGATSSATATNSGSATGSGRTSQPSTSSGLPVSGSVGTTMALIFGGVFFIISGLWSFWVSRQYSTQEVND